jgi:hypothetical protein
MTAQDIPPGTTPAVALQMLTLLGNVLALDDTTQEAAATALGSIAETFRTHEDANEGSRATAAVFEDLCRLIRTARAELAATEGAHSGHTS